MNLPEEVAFFIAQRLRTNVRELEGALNRVKAMQDFKGGDIDIDFVRDTLKIFWLCKNAWLPLKIFKKWWLNIIELRFQI